MLLRKNRKNKHRLPTSEVNVVSLLDIMTTLLFFIILIMSFSKFSVVNAFYSPAANVQENEKIFSLEVKFINTLEAKISLGPTNKLKIIDLQSLDQYLKKNFKGEHKKGHIRKITSANFQQLLEEIQTSLIYLKKSFPHQHQAVASFSDSITFQEMIDGLDSIRSVVPKKSFEITNLLQKKEKTSVLFPQVHIIDGEEN